MNQGVAFSSSAQTLKIMMLTVVAEQSTQIQRPLRLGMLACLGDRGS